MPDSKPSAPGERDHGAPITDDERAQLTRVSTATLIDRLLVPQHTAMRAGLAALQVTAARLARGDLSRSRIMRRASTMVTELAEVLVRHLDHEEETVFPLLIAGVTPIHALGDIHDHHGDIDGRLHRLRALTADLIAPTEVTEDTVVLFETLATFLDLAQRHHAIEHDVLLARFR